MWKQAHFVHPHTLKITDLCQENQGLLYLLVAGLISPLPEAGSRRALEAAEKETGIGQASYL